MFYERLTGLFLEVAAEVERQRSPSVLSRTPSAEHYLLPAAMLADVPARKNRGYDVREGPLWAAGTRS